MLPSKPAPQGLRLACAALLLTLGACATVQYPQDRHLQSADAAVRECAQWFQDTDAAVDTAGVRDREAAPVPGFPYLRSTRLLAALAPVAADDGLKRRWMELLRAADQSAREAELRNLAAGSARTDTAQRCGDLLLRNDQADPAVAAVLPERAQVADAYADWLRVAGLYALTRIPFAGGVAQWHEEAKAMFARSRSGAAAAHPVIRYGPLPAARYTRAEVAQLLARAAAEPFGLPRFDATEAAKLFATYAPVFEVETAGPHDRPGALRWADADHPVIDPQRPVVYQRLAHTRYAGRTLLQLVYTMWFSERPVEKSFDILAGKLDGVVWRVTLAPDGQPVVFDTMHPCGCYHMFLPTPVAAALPAPEAGDEWAFIPATLPRVGEGEQVRLRLATGSHYLIDAGLQPHGSGTAVPYSLIAEDVLRSLPLPGGGFRSVYGPDALISGTERTERLLFWPMGIPSAGAMRQWGNHATAFLGRRHFDDADLIERRFRLQLD
jgi:hypothetical protein